MIKKAIALIKVEMYTVFYLKNKSSSYCNLSLNTQVIYCELDFVLKAENNVVFLKR